MNIDSCVTWFDIIIPLSKKRNMCDSKREDALNDWMIWVMLPMNHAWYIFDFQLTNRVWYRDHSVSETFHIEIKFSHFIYFLYSVVIIIQSTGTYIHSVVITIQSTGTYLMTIHIKMVPYNSKATCRLGREKQLEQIKTKMRRKLYKARKEATDLTRKVKLLEKEELKKEVVFI